jgi:hypothetical protein
MATKSESWAAAEIEDDIASNDAKRIAHHIAGIVANEDRIAAAIQSAIDRKANAQEILAAVAEALIK